MNSFKLSMPSSVIFGSNNNKDLINEVHKYGNSVLFALDENTLVSSDKITSLLNDLDKENIKYKIIKFSKYDLDSVEKICTEYTSSDSYVLVALGGKDIINVCKIAKYTISLKQSVLEELNDNKDDDIVFKFLPLIVIPTSSSLECALESTVVIDDESNGTLRCIEHLHFIPDAALIDPEYCFDCEYETVIYNALYTLASLIEIYVSQEATLLSDLLSIEGIKYMVVCIDYLLKNKTLSYSVKEGICYASLLAGMASHNVSAGVIKGLTYALKTKTDVSMEELNAIVMYQCILKNMTRVQFFEEHEDIIEKYAKVGSLLSGIDYSYEKKDLLMRAMSEYMDKMYKQFRIGKLSDIGISSDDLYNIASNVNLFSNPIELADTEIMEILEKCM